MPTPTTLPNIGLRRDQSHKAWVPGSKSYTNRALILAAQRVGTTEIHNALICDDTKFLADALSTFGGLNVEQKGQGFVVTRSAERLTAPERPLYVGGAGTPARFLIAFAAAVEGTTRVTGNARLSERPMGDLIDAMTGAGFAVRSAERPNCLPVDVTGGPPASMHWRVNGSVSSQFASAMLLLAAQQTAERVTVEVTSDLVSVPYVNMTLAMMGDAGLRAERVGPSTFAVVPGRPTAAALRVEPDASGMSYALTAAVLTHSTVQIQGIGSGSVQGDVGLVQAYVRMGCQATVTDDTITLTGAPLHGIEIDMETMPDVVLSLAMAASQASSPTRIFNIANLRVKECDRIHAIANGLSRLGIRTEEGPDWIVVHPGTPQAGMVHCFDDHRVAMAFSLLGLVHDGIQVDDAECVKKSFPEYWHEMGRFAQAVGDTAEA